jgi:hypothetical protein
MALVPSTLASLLKTNLAAATDAATSNTILSNTLSSYLLTNTIFNFSWIGALPAPPFTPDPIIIATGTFTTLTITITPSGATTAPLAQAAVKNQIITGMTSAIYNITTLGFACTPAPMSSSATLSTLDLSLTVTPVGDTAMIEMCTKIIDWVKQLAPAGTCAGTHTTPPAYTGVGTVTTIS